MTTAPEGQRSHPRRRIRRQRRISPPREQLQKTFGYYLPPAMVAELCGAAGGIPTASRDAYAVCLFSDAERYTTLAEGIADHTGDEPAVASRRLEERVVIAIEERVQGLLAVYLDEVLGGEPARRG